MGGNSFGIFPFLRVGFTPECAIACKCELATGRSRCALEDNITNRVWIAMVGHTIDDNFCNSQFTLSALKTGFVINRLCQTLVFGADFICCLKAVDWIGRDSGNCANISGVL